jgi:hypothetical protein
MGTRLEQYISPHPSGYFSRCHTRSYAWSYLLHCHRGESGKWRGILALILGTAQVFHLYRPSPAIWNCAFPGRMFGDRRVSQTFTASYPILYSQARMGSISLGLLAFGCKLTESYFLLTLAFRDFICAP